MRDDREAPPSCRRSCSSTFLMRVTMAPSMLRVLMAAIRGRAHPARQNHRLLLHVHRHPTAIVQHDPCHALHEGSVLRDPPGQLAFFLVAQDRARPVARPIVSRATDRARRHAATSHIRSAQRPVSDPGAASKAAFLGERLDVVSIRVVSKANLRARLGYPATTRP
jgi:hypothetical protein